MVNVQGRAASGRYDRFHDEIAAVGLGAVYQEGVSVTRSPVTLTGIGRQMECGLLICHLLFLLLRLSKSCRPTKQAPATANTTVSLSRSQVNAKQLDPAIAEIPVVSLFISHMGEQPRTRFGESIPITDHLAMVAPL